jgi:hypothetical protein
MNIKRIIPIIYIVCTTDKHKKMRNNEWFF